MRYNDADLARLTNASSDLEKGRDWWVVFVDSGDGTWGATCDVQARNPRDARHLAMERCIRLLGSPLDLRAYATPIG